MKCEYCGISSWSSLFVKEGSSWGFLNYFWGPAIIMASQVLAGLAVSRHYSTRRQLKWVCSPVCLLEGHPVCTLWAHSSYSLFHFLHFAYVLRMSCCACGLGILHFFSPHEHINFGNLRCSGWVLSWAHLLRFYLISGALLFFYLSLYPVT